MEQELIPPKPNYAWIRYLHKRIEDNQNFLGIVSGAPGKGKSWTAISIGQLVDPTFNIDRVVFKAKDLMALINSGDLKSGSVIVFDEVGVDLGNRSWQSTMNKMLNYLFQTFRHRNYIILFTTPYSDFVDAGTRKLFHAEFKCLSINKRKKTCKISPINLQYNSSMKKTYHHHLKRRIPGGGMIAIKTWNVPAPSKEFIQYYEKRKLIFTSNLNREIEEAINKVSDEGKKELTDRQDDILKCWEKGIFIQTKISQITGVPQGDISKNTKYIKNKGYNIKEYQAKIENAIPNIPNKPAP